MARKERSDEKIVAIIEARVAQANGLNDGKLSLERTTVQKYIDGAEPRQTDGVSKYVSRDVYDGVEAMTAQLLEVFAGDQTPITFAPQGADDEAQASEATEACSWVIFRQNPGYEILRDTIRDSLSCRVGIAQVWWDAGDEEYENTVKDIPYADFEAMLAADPEVELTELSLDRDLAMVKSATLVKTRDISQVRIETVPPEEFGITKRAKSPDDAELQYRRRGLSADELVRMGVKPSLVRELRDDGRYMSDTSGENIARHMDTDDTLPSQGGRDSDDQSREIDTTESYIRADFDGRPKMWRVLTAHGKLLLKEQVKRRPFVFFVALPRQHSFWGNNFAKNLIPTQNARTLLTRSIVNHALITNNPRFGVVKGGVTNPKELTDNRVGGLVNLTRPDAIVPITQTGLNPFVFQTIQLLDEDKEETTGISKLSQGLNKDAISKQNSADMVNNLIGASQTRQKIVARNFSEGFLKPLYLEVYRLLVEHQDKPKLIQIAGEWTEVDPSTWPERDDLVAEVSVGYGEQEAAVKRWMAIDGYLAGDPRFKAAYTPQNRYGVVVRALRAGGIRDVNSIVLPPEQWEEEQPDPMQQAELAEKNARAAQMQAQAEATGKDAEMAVVKMQHEREMIALKTQAERDKLDIERERWAIEREKMLMKREMFMAELAAAQAADKTTGVLAPDA